MRLRASRKSVEIGQVSGRIDSVRGFRSEGEPDLQARGAARGGAVPVPCYGIVAAACLAQSPASRPLHPFWPSPCLLALRPLN